MEFGPGSVVAGKYRIERKLGSGGAGEVWQAENVSIGVRVALKKLRQASSRDATLRFRREAVILARVRSDYVARVLDFLDDPEFGYVLVLDLIEGEPLSETLKLKKLGLEEAIGLGTDLLAGLADLHRARIVHRDLKPSNIIEQLFDDGTRRAVIVDFGVSRLLADAGSDEDAVTDITRGAMTIGTLTYMAPEQLVNSSKIGYEADLYAVGTLLYRAVAGELPFGSMSPAALAAVKRLDEAPALVTGRTDARATSFEAIVARALRKRPAERYPTAEAMLADLRALKGEPGESALRKAPIQDPDSEASFVTEPMLELTPAQMSALAGTTRQQLDPPTPPPAAWTPPSAPATPEPTAAPAAAPAPTATVAEAAAPSAPPNRTWPFALMGFAMLVVGVGIGWAMSLGARPEPRAADASPAPATASATASGVATAPSAAPSASSDAPSAASDAPSASSDAPAADDDEPPAAASATPSASASVEVPAASATPSARASAPALWGRLPSAPSAKPKPAEPPAPFPGRAPAAPYPPPKNDVDPL